MSKPSGLTTLAIESKREEIAAAKAELAKLIRMRKDARIQMAAERAAAKELKAYDRAEKKAMRIATAVMILGFIVLLAGVVTRGL